MKQDWSHKKLTDLCAIQYGFAFDSSYFNDSGGGLPLIRIRDVVRGFSETYYSGAYPPEYIVKKGDYLIGMDGEFNIAQWKGGEALLNQRVCKISSKSDSYIERFAYYFLCRILKEIEDETPFVTVKHLSAKRLNQILTPVPSIEEQKKICSLLDKMNRVIEAKKEQLKELDNLAQAIFYDMFGDPVTNEKGWEIQTMGGFGSFQRGLLLQKKDFVEKGHPCIHYGQLHTSFGSYTTKHLTCISEELFSKSKIAHTGDLVLALTSEDIEGSCKSTAWLGDFDIAVGSDAAIFSHNQNAIYLSFYTRTKAFYNEKEKYARGFKVTHIKTTDIAKIPICLPPISLQQAFAEKVEAIERQKELINQSIREVQTLFDSRMDYWFSEEDDDFGQLDKLD